MNWFKKKVEVEVTNQEDNKKKFEIKGKAVTYTICGCLVAVVAAGAALLAIKK